MEPAFWPMDWPHRFQLDMFLAANITLSILVLLSVVTLKDTLDLSVFPSLLLVATLARLALNV